MRSDTPPPPLFLISYTTIMESLIQQITSSQSERESQDAAAAVVQAVRDGQLTVLRLVSSACSAFAAVLCCAKLCCHSAVRCWSSSLPTLDAQHSPDNAGWSAAAAADRRCGPRGQGKGCAAAVTGIRGWGARGPKHARWCLHASLVFVCDSSTSHQHVTVDPLTLKQDGCW